MCITATAVIIPRVNTASLESCTMVEVALPCRHKYGKWTAHPVDHVWSSSPDVSRCLLQIRILRTASSAEVLQVLSSWNVVTRGTSAKDPAVRQDSFSNEHNAMDNLGSNTFVLSVNGLKNRRRGTESTHFNKTF
jgi:hypothetical protein